MSASGRIARWCIGTVIVRQRVQIQINVTSDWVIKIDMCLVCALASFSWCLQSAIGHGYRFHSWHFVGIKANIKCINSSAKLSTYMAMVPVMFWRCVVSLLLTKFCPQSSLMIFSLRLLNGIFESFLAVWFGFLSSIITLAFISASWL